MTTDVATLESEAITWRTRAGALLITDGSGYAIAGQLLVAIKGLRTQIATACDPVISAAFAAHRAATAQKRDLEAPLVEAEWFIRAKVTAYLDAEERQRRALEAQLAAEARKAEDDARLVEAAALEEAGEVEQAAAVLDAPAMPAPIILPTPKAAGVSTSVRWKAQVTDLLALVRAIAAGKAPPTMVAVVQSQLDSYARLNREQARLDGVRFYPERGIAVRNS